MSTRISSLIRQEEANGLPSPCHSLQGKAPAFVYTCTGHHSFNDTDDENLHGAQVMCIKEVLSAANKRHFTIFLVFLKSSSIKKHGLDLLALNKEKIWRGIYLSLHPSIIRCNLILNDICDHHAMLVIENE